MTDVETRLRHGLAALAAQVQPTVRPAPTRAPRSRRRWAILAPAIVGGLTLSGVAAATGLLPDPVRDRFREMADWGSVGHLDPDDAQMVAFDEVDGRRYELWTAEGAGGGRCEYLREIVAGQPENGSRICNVSDVLLFGRDDFWLGGTGSVRMDGSHPVSEQYGRAPRGTTEVGVVDRDGNERRLPVSADGWFLDVRLEPLRPWRSYVAYDADGRVVTRYDQP